jgi:MFS family permease
MSATKPAPPSDGHPDRFTSRTWAMLSVLCGAVFLEGIDVSMVGVALPSIRSDLGLSTASLQWVVSAYVLGYGGFVLLGGRAADLLGRRRMFVLWLGVFLAFSGLGGLAGEGWVLILARFVTGVSAGFMTPAALSIITTSFAEGPARNRALLIYAGTAAGGFSLGLVVGGLLTSLDWRWTFFAPVVMAAVLLVAAVRLVPDQGRPARAAGGFDVAGATSLTGAMLLLVFGVVRAPDVGWLSTIATLTGSAILLATFVAVERRSASPLVRLGILRSGSLARANLGALLFVGSFIAFQFVVVLYLQELRGWSALETGLALLVVGSDTVLAPTVTPYFVNRFGTVRVILAGMVLAAVAYALFLPLGPEWSYVRMLPTLILISLAFALAYGALTIAATEGVAEQEQGLAGGLLNVSFQFGAALGLAVATAVHVAAIEVGGGPETLLDAYQAALIVPVAGTLLGVAVTALGLRGRTRLAAQAGGGPSPAAAEPG